MPYIYFRKIILVSILSFCSSFIFGQDLVSEIEPFLGAVYGQVNCYDNDSHSIYPTNYYTPNHYAPGCVAISFVTMMEYYQWPNKGTGIHQNIDSHGNSTGTYVVNYDEASYDWNLILPRYHYMTSTEAEQEQLGKLTYGAAIALNMEFENTGSTSNVNRIPNAGKDYFSYMSVYKSYTSPSFWASLDSNIVHHLPVTLAIDAPNGAGHSCVIDGMRTYSDGSTSYHLNLGWWGDVNGWYDIRSGWNAGGYTSITGGVFDFLPKPYMAKPVKLNEDNIYLLEWEMSSEVVVEEYELRRKINTGLWHTLATDALATSLEVQVGVFDDYFFEIRAKIDGKWYLNGWSNQVKAEETLVATENLTADDFSIYPNPSIDNLNIELAENWIGQDVKVNIFSLDGRQLSTTQLKAAAHKIVVPCAPLSPGLYLVELQANKQYFRLKMVKG